MFNGKLKIGYSVFSKFLVSVDNKDVADIRIANEKFVVPALIKVL